MAKTKSSTGPNADPSRQVLGAGASARPADWGSAPVEEFHVPLRADYDPRWFAPLSFDFQLHTAAEFADGGAELEILRETYGNVLNKKADFTYAKHDANGWHYRVEEYLNDREHFFGRGESYAKYKQIALAELDADNGKLRGFIDPNVKTRNTKPQWRDAQVAFYAWTRRAYENAVPAGVDIPTLIKAGMSQKLRDALRAVQVGYGKNFNPEGFNPRPIKTTRGYRLGTLSDHALGTAADIRPSANAQIEPEIWKDIESFTGKSLDTPTRKRQWRDSPRQLYDALTDINSLFVSKLQEPAPAAAPGAPAAPAPKRSRGWSAFTNKWQKGFFDLPWELVSALHEEQFVWGATFGRLDLHHFELP
jgi:hypothetical protein